MNRQELELVQQAALKFQEKLLAAGDLRRLNKRQRELLREAAQVFPELYRTLREAQTPRGTQQHASEDQLEYPVA